MNHDLKRIGWCCVYALAISWLPLALSLALVCAAVVLSMRAGHLTQSEALLLIAIPTYLTGRCIKFVALNTWAEVERVWNLRNLAMQDQTEAAEQQHRPA